MTKKQLELQERNKAFMNMSASEKRVKIAQDVLLHLKARKITPTTGSYILSEYIPYEMEELDIQSNFSKVKCDVCALGSLFIADVFNRNNCIFDELYDTNSDKITKRMQDYFDLKTLCLIELAFEAWDFEDVYDDYDNTLSNGILSHENEISEYGITAEEIETACSMYKNLTEKQRLTKIMNNIIENKGEFVLQQLIKN